MIVVIQCAASKKPDAGHLQLRDGRKILFVADPNRAPAGDPYVYARPDDVADTGRSWRDELIRYNEAPGGNPLGLLPAWRLYENATYGLLAQRLGTERLFILSAGWGLISADFLTPKYDITYSTEADAYKRRRRTDRYNDLRMLSANVEEPVVFFISKAYVPLAAALTEHMKAPRHLFYNSRTPPDAPGFIRHFFETRARTNWQYECAKSFLAGKVSV